MGKRVKLPAKQPQEPRQDVDREEADDDQLMAELEQNLREAVVRLRDVISMGDTSPQVIREFNGANRTLIALVAERRQQRKARKNERDAVSVALVLDRLRQMTPDEREYVRSTLDALDRKGSVLG